MEISEIIEYLDTCIKCSEIGQDITADLIIIRKNLEQYNKKEAQK